MKKRQIILITIFCLIIFILPVFFGINLFCNIDNASFQDLEKRTVAPLPKISQTGFSNWPEAVEIYIRDHIPFRHNIIKTNAFIDEKLFNTTTSQKVMFGKDGWLFFKDYTGVTNIADYQGRLTLSENQLTSTVDSLNALQQAMQQQGCETVLFVPPNKEQVYEKYLPNGINKVSEISRVDTLYSALAKGASDVILVDPKPILKQYAKTDDLLYYKYDTHWTSQGCYLALTEFLTALDVPHTSFEQTNFAFNNSYHTGDLASLSALTTRNDDKQYILDDPRCASFVTTQVAGGEMVENPNATDKRHILFLGDSFSYEIRKQLCCYFSKVTFIPFEGATAETIQNNPADVLVIQQVERNIENLINILPTLS